MRSLLIIAAFSFALTVPIFGQGNAPKKATPRPSSPVQVALKSLVGRHLYVCKGSNSPLNTHISGKSAEGYLFSGATIQDYFVQGQKLTIAAIDVNLEPSESYPDGVTVFVTLRSEENGAVAVYPMMIKKKDVSPTYIYLHLSTVEEFSSHPPKGVTIGSPESDVYCTYGTPNHMNDDVYMLQLVYDDYGKYIYVDNRTGKVVNIQTSY